ncbi:hypothetical protein [Prauserella muralis]|uniref:Uncharacterized protein n=1 Tax=Prauserella muralis TaxID=588067 RepID=A0A2V4ALG5_9PSEU|nr:hypothetical protein [Prauserella muralis]PXY21138.1 hypothetical protein BAY60_27105 [Prauserella muralis]TWE30226.1 hypothetical protein FHX69_2923 [Prauserella muralis]
MPRKPTPPPPELEHVRELTAEIERLQAVRGRAMVAAKLAGATGDQLAEAAKLGSRNKVYDALRDAGHDTGKWRDPPPP